MRVRVSELSKSFAVFEDLLLLKAGQTDDVHQRQWLESLDFASDVRFKTRNKAAEEGG